LANSFDKTLMGAAAAAGGGPPDDQFNLVSFLSHFDGSNDGVNNVFDDGSYSNHTITANGNVTQGSFGPFARPDGEWAVSLNTNTILGETGYLRAPSSGDFGTGDFTYEAWIYMIAGGGNPVLLANSGGAVAVFRFGNTTSYLFGNNDTSGQTSVSFGDLSAATFQWNHIALVRSSGVIKCYLNGTASSTTLSSSQTTGAAEYIGTARNYTSGSRLFDGYISNVRFSDVARYTSNFTPSTAPFVSDSNTDLLTCQSNRFVDNSSNGRTVTPYGSAGVTAFSPFLTSSVYDPAVNGGSAHLSATTDYLSAANSSEFFMENDAYTIEFWTFGGPANGSQYIFDNYKTGLTGGMTMYLTTAGKIHFRFSGNTGGYKDTVTSNGAFIISQWSHIAVVRTYVSSNTTVVIYVNGVAKATETFNGITAQSNTSEALTIGDAYQGYICDFRMVKGTAVYTGNFTPPTAPLTAVTNTKLLLNMKNGQAIDSAAQNNLTLYGTAKTSTAQKKFGTASLLLDGNSDYVSFADTDAKSMFNFGASKWTIEGWFYQENNASSGSSSHSIISRWDNQNNDKGFIFRITNSSGQKLQWYHTTDGSTNRVHTDSRTISNNTWYHFALVKNDNLTLYLNGTGAVLNSSAFTIKSTTIPTLIGSVHESGSPSQYFNGYIDDLRVSHMARYTSDFTAPTKAFADKGQ